MHRCRAARPEPRRRYGSRLLGGINAGEEAHDLQAGFGFVQAAILAQVFPATRASGSRIHSRNGPAMGIAGPAVINVTFEHQPNSLGTRTGDKKVLSASGVTGMRRKTVPGRLRIVSKPGAARSRQSASIVRWHGATTLEPCRTCETPATSRSSSNDLGQEKFAR